MLAYGGGRHSAVKLLLLRPESWVDGAGAVAGRNLTPEAWNTHIGDLAEYRQTCPL